MELFVTHGLTITRSFVQVDVWITLVVKTEAALVFARHDRPQS